MLKDSIPSIINYSVRVDKKEVIVLQVGADCQSSFSSKILPSFRRICEMYIGNFCLFSCTLVDIKFKVHQTVKPLSQHWQSLITPAPISLSYLPTFFSRKIKRSIGARVFVCQRPAFGEVWVERFVRQVFWVPCLSSAQHSTACRYIRGFRPLNIAIQ